MEIREKKYETPNPGRDRKYPCGGANQFLREFLRLCVSSISPHLVNISISKHQLALRGNPKKDEKEKDTICGVHPKGSFCRELLFSLRKCLKPILGGLYRIINPSGGTLRVRVSRMKPDLGRYLGIDSRW